MSGRALSSGKDSETSKKSRGGKSPHIRKDYATENEQLKKKNSRSAVKSSVSNILQ